MHSPLDLWHIDESHKPIRLLQVNFKVNYRSRFRANINNQKFKVALTPPLHGFINFAKRSPLAYWLLFNIKKWGSMISFFSYNHLKLKLGVFLTGYTVAMVIWYVKMMIISCLVPLSEHPLTKSSSIDSLRHRS